MVDQKIRINNSLIGILSLPDHVEAHAELLSATLLLHGFGTDKNEVNSVFTAMSSLLIEKNIVCLRIDFRGFGESDGLTENASMDTMLEDALAAFDYLSQLPYVNRHSVGMVGFSLGAAIAMLVANQVPCRALALLSPALNLKQDFTTFLGQKIMDDLRQCQDFIEIELPWRNIRIGRAFYDALLSHHPLASIKHYEGSLFCMAGDQDFSRENAESIYREAISPAKSIQIIKNADHILSRPDGSTELLNATSAIAGWLKENLPINHTQDSVWHSEVRSYELDIQNIVNNANYLHYFDHARLKMLHEKGVDWEVWNKIGYNLVLAHVDMSLRAPLRANELFYVTSSLELSGRIKMLFKQKIFRQPDNKLIAEAINTVVCVSIKNSKPSLPTELSTLLFPERNASAVI